MSDNSKKKADWEKRHFGVNAVIAIVGALALIIYGFQLHEMRKSTDAATEATKLARENAHVDQRAWVSPFQVPLNGTPQVGSKFTVRVPFKNTGKTFAREVTAYGEFHFMKVGTESFVYINENEPVRGLLLAPGGDYTLGMTTDEPMTQDVFDKIRSPEWRALFFGYITYYDIFDCVHWTIFCFALNAEKGEWTIYKEHNDADNDRCP